MPQHKGGESDQSKHGVTPPPSEVTFINNYYRLSRAFYYVKNAQAGKYLEMLPLNVAVSNADRRFLRTHEMSGGPIRHVSMYEGFELGPMLAYRPGRKSVENNKVDRLPNTDNAAEAGGITRYWLPLGLPARQAVGVDLSGAADVSNAYDGWWIQPGVDYKAGLRETVGLSARVFSDYASADYMDEFFNISSGQSARGGLRQFYADAGWKRGPVARRHLAVRRALVHRGGRQLRAHDRRCRRQPGRQERGKQEPGRWRSDAPSAVVEHVASSWGLGTVLAKVRSSG